MANGGGSSPMLAGVSGLLRALPGLLPTLLVIALLACVLVPLPTALVDLLLSLSLAAAVLLLVAALLVRRTTDFLAFPTLLLLLTLYRLALNVSTTRLILSQADAGRVIDAFAEVVVRGDLLVGGVMFAIITAMQYLVIARGAERVAEVGARFALDGLPGHQAAIDADLRARVISAREASARRARLGERSNFYGAMDGAMRFVKGDAIVGLVITAINLLGGIAVARWRHDLGMVDGLSLYGRLTIGDGLLSQIPALLVSLAAGVLVSRVDRQDGARVAFAWLEPRMLLVPAAFLALMAMVPGMPTLAFVATAIGLVTLALLLSARELRQRPTEAERGVGRLRLLLGDAAAQELRTLERAIEEVCRRCASTLRLELPELDVQPEPTLGEHTLELWFEDRRLLRCTLPGGVARDETAVLSVFRALMDHAELFVALPAVEHALDDLRGEQPGLVDRALQGRDGLEVAALLRGFVRERVPCPRLSDVLAALADCPPELAGRRDAELAFVRERLAPTWLPPMLDALARLEEPRWLRFEPDAEQELVLHRVGGALGGRLQLDEATRVRWVAPLTDAPVDLQRRPVVLLATPAARAVVAELTRGVVPHVTVLSLAELDAARFARPIEPRWLAMP
ncbi:MAG: FHIPEP family type III secretion protein [Deltaproteobacteria bacterium]|nr:FHIPEP family type III secretion protein [Deltaproteobacteria bacterium]MBK8714267.1 FHIPEP family type III secretion protein [Deltaproteobacteria bacterium]MBP7285943.1 FHIPEP family type III secretion protein [Nannocystaceae bacterium]